MEANVSFEKEEVVNDVRADKGKIPLCVYKWSSHSAAPLSVIPMKQ